MKQTNLFAFIFISFGAGLLFALTLPKTVILIALTAALILGGLAMLLTGR